MIGKLNLPVLADADVVVLGGGPSGVAAALAAARNGAQVLLVEQFGALGGLGTTGLVPMFAPTSDGERMIYGGIFREINLEMCSRMKVEPWRESWQAINPEILKRLLDEKIAQAGVRVLYCAKLCEAEMDGGRILAVLAATSMGLKKITGRVFVDATGDGLLAALSGAEFEYGDANGIPMSPTLCGQFSGIDWDKVAEVGKTGVNDHTIWAEMLRNGTAPLPEQHFVCMKPVSSRSASSDTSPTPKMMAAHTSRAYTSATSRTSMARPSDTPSRLTICIRGSFAPVMPAPPLRHDWSSSDRSAPWWRRARPPCR